MGVNVIVYTHWGYLFGQPLCGVSRMPTASPASTVGLMRARSVAAYAACVGVLALALVPQALGLHGAPYLAVVVPPLAAISLLTWWTVTRRGRRSR